MGNATNQVTCVLAGREIGATADTGSEIALVSGDYAVRNGLLREYGCEELELADGSRISTSGYGDLEFAVRTPSSFSKLRTKMVRFHVVKSLQFDVILDEDIVEDFKIFRNGLATMVSTAFGTLASLGPISHLGPAEQSMTTTKDKIKGWASSLLLGNSPTNGKTTLFCFIVAILLTDNRAICPAIQR